MHADFRLTLGKLVTLLAAISSVQAFYIPGTLRRVPESLPQARAMGRLTLC